MSVRQGIRPVTARHNRRLGWVLGGVALILYLAIAFRWTQGF